jgi:glycosyltransferase involved in cell wall biosynthesis
MKIGIDASFLRKPGTGIGQVTKNFLQALMKPSFFGGPGKSWQFLAGLQEAEFILYAEEPIGMPLLDRFTVRIFLPKWWKRDDVIRKLLWEKQVAEEALQDGCDMFISLSQSATVFPIAHFSSPTTQFQHVMVVHDIIPKLFPEYLRKISQKIHWRAIEQGIRSADHIVAISSSTKNDLVMKLGIVEEKILVAHPGLSPAFETVCTEKKVDSVLAKYHLDRGYIYHGGGLEVRKNTEGVLRAYQQLTANSEQSAEIPKLVISGKIHAKSNMLATDVAGLVEELGLEENVQLLGFVPDEEMPALYRGAIFFVYPSRYEGFGLPPLEAMSQGTPVIVSNVSSLPEACGSAAVYVDANQSDEIDRQMRLLLTDATKRTELGMKGFAQAKRFTWESFMKAVLQ